MPTAPSQAFLQQNAPMTCAVAGVSAFSAPSGASAVVADALTRLTPAAVRALSTFGCAGRTTGTGR
eukprot:scaffold138611_cov33-Tisochrysis_lutea.AAC.7